MRNARRTFVFLLTFIFLLSLTGCNTGPTATIDREVYERVYGDVPVAVWDKLGVFFRPIVSWDDYTRGEIQKVSITIEVDDPDTFTPPTQMDSKWNLVIRKEGGREIGLFNILSEEYTPMYRSEGEWPVSCLLLDEQVLVLSEPEEDSATAPLSKATVPFTRKRIIVIDRTTGAQSILSGDAATERFFTSSNVVVHADDALYFNGHQQRADADLDAWVLDRTYGEQQDDDGNTWVPVLYRLDCADKTLEPVDAYTPEPPFLLDGHAAWTDPHYKKIRTWVDTEIRTSDMPYWNVRMGSYQWHADRWTEARERVDIAIGAMFALNKLHPPLLVPVANDLILVTDPFCRGNLVTFALSEMAEGCRPSPLFYDREKEVFVALDSVVFKVKGAARIQPQYFGDKLLFQYLDWDEGEEKPESVHMTFAWIDTADLP